MKTKDVQEQLDQSAFMVSWDLYGPMIQKKLHEHCGLMVQDHELPSLRRAVSQCIQSRQGISLGDYYGLLTQSDNQEWKELLNILTIKHTFFFRNQPQFKALKQVVLPELLQHKKRMSSYKKPTLNIWSAGCATGEEPYSIAMMLHDCLNLKEWQVKILATDISEQALHLAQLGVYSDNALQSLDHHYRSRFFAPKPSFSDQKGFAIHENIKKLVRFEYLNLMNPEYPKNMDIIFCRNVMIYFDSSLIQDVIRRFEQGLLSPGYLFIGHSESLQGLGHHLQLRHQEEGVFYQKADQDLTEQPNTPQKPPCHKSKRRLVAVPIQPTSTPASRPLPEQLLDIQTAYNHKDYDQALRWIHQAQHDYPETDEPLFYAAQIYLNQRHFDLAGAALQRLLQRNPMYAQGYYLQGLLALEQHKLEDAEDALKKAVYIEHRFPMAHFTLALAYSQHNKISAAIREYRNALKILMQQDNLETEVDYSGGFSHETLICICHNSLERLKGKYETCHIHA